MRCPACKGSCHKWVPNLQIPPPPKEEAVILAAFGVKTGQEMKRIICATCNGKGKIHARR